MSTPGIVILTGPTATGKSELAIRCAEECRSQGIQLELINADSLCVYRELNVGTAKPSAADLRRAVHHLIDIRNPDQPYTAGDFRRDVERTLQDIHARGARALLVGGTGFYLKALTHGMWDAPKSPPELRQSLEARESAELFAELQAKDPTSANRIGGNDRYRIIRALEIIATTGQTVAELEKKHLPSPVAPYRLIIIDRERADLNERIRARAMDMEDKGIVTETAQVLKKYGPVRPLLSVGYAQTVDYLEGRKPQGRPIQAGYDGLIDEIELATQQLVKRQRTWFRGLENAERFTLPVQDSELIRTIMDGYVNRYGR